MSAEKNDRRNNERFWLNLRAQYRIWESDFPFSVITTVNISEYGMCFKSDAYVENGCSVELTVRLDQEEADLLGKVVWSHPTDRPGEYLTGVEIMNVHSDDAKQLAEYCRKKEEESRSQKD